MAQGLVGMCGNCTGVLAFVWRFSRLPCRAWPSEIPRWCVVLFPEESILEDREALVVLAVFEVCLRTRGSVQ